jgi:hypothetical protein
MHARAVRAAVISLGCQGVSASAIARTTGMPRSTIREWLADPDAALAAHGRSICFACASRPCPHPGSYAYLLGQYLGDGYLVTSARVPKLRIACADAYPVIASEVDAAMALLSGNKSGSVQGIGCSDHYCYWNHWPCHFPQHGPGMKHTRPIVLADWQQALVHDHPWPLIRGLIHSDGCRSMNRVVVRGKAYAYSRYLFANESRDILSIMGTTLDRVGVEWRYNRPNSISVARRSSVALMDEHVGPKT